MTVITEGTLKLTFAAGWCAIKIDDTDWYRDGDAIANQVKAVDITAYGPQEPQEHWWIEIKDCFGHEQANRPRLVPNNPKPQELLDTEVWIKAKGWDDLVEAKRVKMFVVDEVVQKVAGTITTLAVASRAPTTESRAVAVQPYAKAFAPGVALKVVLFLTWSGPDFGVLASRLKTAMEQRLHAFNVTCLVVNETVTAPAQPWTVGRTAP
ncbi:hypothetical protein [Azohydromonas lata]|uniref:hypothetical protein n=1 Tax=Azohydromonas lata TaxID=45677 RepID=UPI0012F48836|nr:hypothetical protein [Azohydromonas lata]